MHAEPTTADTTAGLAAPRFGARAAWFVLVAYIAGQMLFGFLALRVGWVVHTMYGLPGVPENASFGQFTRIIQPYMYFTSLGGGAIVALAASHYVVRRRGGESLRTAVGWAAGGAKYLALGGTAGLGTALVFLLLAGWLLPFDPARSVGPLAEMARTPGLPRLLWALMALVLAPVIEEVLFRGVLFTGCARTWGTGPAAVVSTVVFGLLHLPEARVYPPAIGIILLLGTINVVLRIRSGVVGPSIAAHMSYNGVLVLAAFVPV